MKKKQIHTDLLTTGVMLFAEKGYHGTGIKEVVESLRVPKGSFYNYFKSKEHFASEIVEHYTGVLDEVWEVWIASGPESDPLLMLQNCFESLISMQEEQKVQTGCLIGNLAGELAESSERCRLSLNNAKTLWCKRLAFQLSRAQDLGVARTDISSDELAGFCWDVWEGALLRMKVEGSTDSLRKSITMLFQVFLRP
jgi:TetR/AcrR family transcriptional repressor of nem operon